MPKMVKTPDGKVRKWKSAAAEEKCTPLIKQHSFPPKKADKTRKTRDSTY